MAGVRKTSGAGESRGVVYQFPVGRVRVAPTAAADGRDSTGVTPEAREMSRARGVVDAAPEIRAERVRELKEQIANGTYRPDPREVAQAIAKHGL